METWEHFLLFVDFFHEIHDLFVAGTNLLDRYIMVDDIDDTCKIFAHICFDIVWTVEKFRNTVVKVGCDDSVQPAFFVIFVKFSYAVCKQTVGCADEYTSGFTKEIPNLLVAGEAAGGIHGRNRLMGNSLLDVIVFGRNAGKKAAAKCKEVELGTMNLDHIRKYEEELKNAGVDTGDVSPMLLPKYARHER